MSDEPKTSEELLKEEIEQLKFELSKIQTQLGELKANYEVLATSEKTYKSGFENQAKIIASLRTSREEKKVARQLGRIPKEEQPEQSNP